MKKLIGLLFGHKDSCCKKICKNCDKCTEEFLKFECQKCAEAEETDGKIICQRNGQEKEKNDTCAYWWSTQY